MPGTVTFFNSLTSPDSGVLPATADALAYCDLTTGPMGERVSSKERACDIYSRYGETAIVARAFRQAMPYFSLAIARTRLRLRQRGLPEQINR